MASLYPEDTRALKPEQLEVLPPGAPGAGKALTLLNSHRLPLVLWTALCTLFFATLLLGTERLPSSDFSGQFHAFVLFQAREMAAGRLPLWSPGSYGGFPFVGDTQAAVFYPPRWLTVFLSLPTGFSYYLLEVEAIAHIWLTGLFTYALAFAITRERWPAVLAAVAFGLGGYLTSYPTLQLAILETITWLPLVLLFLRVAVSRARPAPWLVAAGLVLGMSALAGHPQTFLHVAYMTAAYYAYLSLRQRWTWTKLLAGGGIFGGMALGTAAAAWLPALRLLQMTTRSAVDYHFAAGGLPMLDYVQLLVPGGLSLWSAGYVGLAAVALALIALWGRRWGERSEILFWAITAMVAAWLALGDAGIIFRLVYFMPGFSLFRQQERLLGIFSLSLALLAAQGAAIWLRAVAATGVRGSLVRRAAVALAVGLAVAAAVLFMVQPNAAEGWLLSWGQQAALAAVVLGLLRVRRWPQQQMVVLILLLALDLYATSLGAMNRQPGSPAAFWPQPAWIDILRSQEPARLDSRYLFHANVGEIYGLENVHGISPLKLQLAADFEELPLLRRWQLLNVTHVLVTHPLPGLPVTLLAELDEGLDPDQPEKAGFLYRYDEALPRAWMSYRPIVVAGAAAAWEAVAGANFDPAAEVVLQRVGVESLPVHLPETPPQVRVSRQGAAALTMQVQTAAPGFLVISEWAYPGWQATVNGRRELLLPANYALQALWLPAGEHEIELRFTSPEAVAGIMLSLLTVLVGVLVVARCEIRVRPVGIASLEPVLERFRGLTPGDWRIDHRFTTYRLPFAGSISISRALIIIFCLGFALRVATLSSQELRGDEAFSYKFAVLPAAEIIPALATVGEPHSPFHYFILHGWMRLAGDSEFAMRYVSLIPGLLAVSLFFQLGRQLHGRRSGFVLAVLLAISQSQVWIGQDVRNHYTLAIFFSLLATLLFLQAAQCKTWYWWFGYAATAALTVYSHYYGLFALLGHGFYLIATTKTRHTLWAWVASGIVAAALFAPWLLLTAGPMTVQNLSDATMPDLAGFLTAVGIELSVGPAFDHWPGRWLFLGALFLVIIGARALWQQRPEWGFMLVSWLAMATLIIFLVRLRRSIFNDYYLTVAAPAWWLLLGTGLMQLWRWRGRWGQTTALLSLALLIGANSAALLRYYTNPFYDRTVGYRPMAQSINAALEAGDLFIAHFPDPALEYYLRHLDLPQTLQPISFNVPQAATEQALAELAAAYSRLWFVPAHYSNWDPENIVFRWLDYHNLKEYDLPVGNLQLLAYRPLHTVERVLTPLNVEVPHQLRLEGAFVAVDGRPVALGEPLVLAPAAKMNVTLVWQAVAAIADDYTVFVHLLAEDGVLVAQHDGIPLLGTRPTTSWQAGERLIDRHEWVLPAELPGQKGTLTVGLYDSHTFDRRPFAHGETALRLAELVFSPAVAGD